MKTPALVGLFLEPSRLVVALRGMPGQYDPVACCAPPGTPPGSLDGLWGPFQGFPWPELPRWERTIVEALERKPAVTVERYKMDIPFGTQPWWSVQINPLPDWFFGSYVAWGSSPSAVCLAALEALDRFRESVFRLRVEKPGVRSRYARDL